MATVFISYAREDRESAATLCTALEAAGWSVWWDPRIKAGQAFDEVIERELEAADCVIVLWSAHSIASEWVRNEASAAAERGVLIPALIDAVKLPLEFRRKQAADLVGWRGDRSHAGFRALCDAAAALSGRASVAPLAGRAVADTPPRWWARGRGLAGVAAAAVVLAIGGYLGATLRMPAGPAPFSPAASTMGNGGDARPAAAGVFDFKWPDSDCWRIYRGDRVAASGCGPAQTGLQAGTYLVQPSSTGVFLPFDVTIRPGATTAADAAAGTFDFRWPGTECWRIYRGDAVAKSGCGGGRHALQEGEYLVKPSSTAVFQPFKVVVRRGRTVTAP